MRTTIRRMENFTLYDYQGVEEQLACMAAKGWRLEKTGNFLWTYRAVEPARMRYAVTYKDASQFDPVPTEEQKVLEGLCEAAGWEPVCGWQQMQIYSTEAENPVPLETDEALRLEVIHRIVKKHSLPANLILLALGLFMTASSINTAVRTPLRFLESNSRIFSALMFFIMTLLQLVNVGSYWRWYRRSQKSVAAGGRCAPLWKGYRKAASASMLVALALSAVYMFLEIFCTQGPYALFFGAYMVLFTALVFIVHGTKNLLKRQGVSRGKNMAVTLTVDFLLAFLLIGGLTWSAIHFGWLSGSTGGTYIYQGQEWNTNPISIPLTISDVTREDFSHIQRNAWQRGSVFLPIRSYREIVFRGDNAPWGFLEYEIWEPKAQWIYDVALEGQLSPSRSSHPEIAWEWHAVWQAEDPEPWGAEAAYQRCLNGEPMDAWVLCWPGRIVSVSLDSTPSGPEMALIGEVLSAG